MTLRSILFTAPAERQLDAILRHSQDAFGIAGRKRYEALLEQALIDLLEDPHRPGATPIGPYIHYHLRHSRRRVSPPSAQVTRPRHLIIARVADQALVVLALAHDSMEDELHARIRQGEADLEG